MCCIGTVLDMVRNIVCQLNKIVKNYVNSWLCPCINKPAFVAVDAEWKFGIRRLKNYCVQATLFYLLCFLLFS